MKNAIQTPVPVESRITDVTVYLSGAQITRTAEISADMQTVVFEKLPAGLKAESIQASAGNGMSIRSVEHTVNYLETADYTKEITELQQKLKELEREQENENNTIELGGLEEALFSENKRLAGVESGLKADELKAAVLFYNERMAAVRETRLACTRRLEDLKKEIAGIKSQLGSFRRTGSEAVSEITITIAASDGEQNVSPRELSVSYYVTDAGWTPSYDIRAKDANSEISLHYNAFVCQKTGENWENVNLTLSTGNPGIGGACPELQPWRLDFYQRPYREPTIRSRSIAKASVSESASAMLRGLISIEEENDYEDEPELDGYAPEEVGAVSLIEAPAPTAVMTESMTSAEYSITAPYSAASGDDGQDVEITVHSLPAEFRYFCVSKLDREVFLLAAVSGWEHLNLVAGEASIFFEGRYVGKSYIDPRKGDEKIDLSLGADKSVIVTRVRGKDFTAKALVGNNVKQTRQWELTARNLKPVPIMIEMQDQIPVSVNKQIVVDAEKISGAKMDEDTGILTWTFTLNPAESKSLTVKYVVTNPKNSKVILE